GMPRNPSTSAAASWMPAKLPVSIRTTSLESAAMACAVPMASASPSNKAHERVAAMGIAMHSGFGNETFNRTGDGTRSPRSHCEDIFRVAFSSPYRMASHPNRPVLESCHERRPAHRLSALPGREPRTLRTPRGGAHVWQVSSAAVRSQAGGSGSSRVPEASFAKRHPGAGGLLGAVVWTVQDDGPALRTGSIATGTVRATAQGRHRRRTKPRRPLQHPQHSHAGALPWRTRSRAPGWRHECIGHPPVDPRPRRVTGPKMEHDPAVHGCTGCAASRDKTGSGGAPP